MGARGGVGLNEVEGLRIEDLRFSGMEFSSMVCEVSWARCIFNVGCGGLLIQDPEQLPVGGTRK